MRVGLSLDFCWQGYRRLAQGDFLPWMQLGYVLMMVPQAQWAQPAALGFSTIIGGTFLASLRQPKTN